jgi:TfoX/Sxy family transcriptional regulator of competence genes
MGESHLRALRSMLDRMALDLDADSAIECKHFFSGAAAYANGRIFMTLTPVGLALKLPEPSRARLIAGGGSPLRYFPNGPLKKDYVVVPETLVTDEGALAPWIEESIAFARTPPRSGKARLRGPD